MRHGGFRSARLMYYDQNARSLVDHADTAFKTNSGVAARFHEKLYIENDDCAGVVWEKFHDDDNIIIPHTTWAEGGGASQSHGAKLIHPKDPKEPYVSSLYKIPVGNDPHFNRTKNYAMIVITSNVVRAYVTQNGLDWVSSEYSAAVYYSSWNTEGDIGIGYGKDSKSNKYGFFKLEIGSSGKITETFVKEYNGNYTFVGGRAIIGWRDGYKTSKAIMIDADGNQYVSKLERYSEYYDEGETDPTKRVKPVLLSYRYQYINGKCYASTIALRGVYWNEILGVYQELMAFTLHESPDGWHDKDSGPLANNDHFNRLTYGRFVNYYIYYFNGNYYINETGSRYLDPWTHESEPFFYIWKFKGSFSSNVSLTDVDNNRHIQVPAIGKETDPTISQVDLYFINAPSVPSDSRALKLSVSCISSNTSNYELLPFYFRDGQVSEPYGYLVIPTSLRPGSYGTHAEGGFVLWDRDLTETPKRPYVFSTTNYMIDVDNATWGVDDFSFSIKGHPGARVQVHENRSSKARGYSLNLDDSGTWHGHLRLHTSGKVTLTSGGTTRTVTIHPQINIVNFLVEENQNV